LSASEGIAGPADGQCHQDYPHWENATMEKNPETNRRVFLAGALAATGATVLATAARAAEPVAKPMLKMQHQPQLKLRMMPFGNSSAMVNRLAKQYKVSPNAVRGIMRATAQGYAAHLKKHSELRLVSPAV